MNEATKRERGTGSLYQRPGTRNWTISYYDSGKLHREATGTDDHKEAEKILRKRLDAVESWNLD